MADIEGLQGFIETEDRDEAPFFTGRGNIIDHIEKLAIKAWERRKGKGLSSATRLLQGAPGAGKTSVLNELERKFPQKGRPGTPLALHADITDISDERETVLLLADAAARGGSYRFRKGESRITKATVAGLGQDTGEHVAVPPATMRQLARMYPPATWRRPVILMVDEIQTAENQASPILTLLHKGCFGLPVIPVFAGLGDSEEVLVQRKISRLSSGAVFSMQSLPEQDGRTCVQSMLERFSIDESGAHEDWPALLTQVSDRWPQHLHNAMRALAMELALRNGRLADTDRNAVLEQERILRTETYRSRMSTEMRESICLTAVLMARLENSRYDMTLANVVQCVLETERVSSRPEDQRWNLPNGMDHRSFIEHLVHRGALQKDADDIYHCPIPSFRRFLINEGRRMSSEIPDPDSAGALPAPPLMIDERTSVESNAAVRHPYAMEEDGSEETGFEP